jgi:alpha-N-arabinofuranosidase
MACQFGTGELCRIEDLDTYTQDAIDLIEFANGGPETTWGAKRVAMGHPAPFNMEFLGVGNEQWGQQYFDRLKPMHAAIKAKHPEIQIVSAAGAQSSGPVFEFAWNNLRGLKADIVDEHYYERPEWFRAHANRYDKYDRSGPKVFAGEFAAQSVKVVSPDNRNDWNCALSEAAFMTGLERNSDVVAMASYAPLFAHIDAWQWTPNLIWFDNLRSYGTPSYYVQKLWGTHPGDTILPASLGDDAAAKGLFASATRTKSGDVILKLVNTNPAPAHLTIDLAGVSNVSGPGQAQVLATADLKAENSLDEPTKFSPVSQPLTNLAPKFAHELPAQSLTVLQIPTR